MTTQSGEHPLTPCGTARRDDEQAKRSTAQRKRLAQVTNDVSASPSLRHGALTDYGWGWPSCGVGPAGNVRNRAQWHLEAHRGMRGRAASCTYHHHR
jgi:hypothetical protein